VSIVLALVGCSTAPPPAPSSPAPTAPVTATPAPIAVTPPTPMPPSPPPAPSVPTCRGDHFDIADLAHADCASSGPSTETLPSAIALSVEPKSLSLAGGARRGATLVATNTSQAEVVIALSTGCGELAKVDSQIEGADGKRVDTTGTECGFGALCGNSIVTVALAPGGTIRAPFTIDARKQSFDDKCVETRVGKVAAGSYKLHVFGLAGLAELTVPVRVR
jgi:hypothetical protein